MIDVVLTADKSVMCNHDLSLMTGFSACLPKDLIPFFAKDYIEKKMFSEAENNKGIATLAVLPLRKIEASLLKTGLNVKVYVPDQIKNVRAKVFGISVMDPLGIGPATSTLLGLSKGRVPYNKFYFEQLIYDIKKYNPTAKIIVGGPGVWEFETFPEEREKYGIDCVMYGEGEELSKSIFKAAKEGRSIPNKAFGKPVKNPPTIVNPAFYGMTEISRGCDRGCRFCDPTLKKFRWFSYDKIVQDVKVNTKNNDFITLLSEDTLRYGCKPGEWTPNQKFTKLIKKIKEITPKRIFFSHGCLSSAVSGKKVVEEVSEMLFTKKMPGGLQVGVETGSPKMIEKYMRNKIKPFESRHWHEIVEQGFQILTENNIIPWATLVMGLEDEDSTDVTNTIELVDRLKQYPSLILPLFFVPLGALKDNRNFIFNQLTDEHVDLLITCSRHTLRWSEYFSDQRWYNASEKLNSSFIDNYFLEVGSNCILKSLEALKKPSRSMNLPEFFAFFGVESMKYMFKKSKDFLRSV